MRCRSGLPGALASQERARRRLRGLAAGKRSSQKNCTSAVCTLNRCQPLRLADVDHGALALRIAELVGARDAARLDLGVARRAAAGVGAYAIGRWVRS